MSSTELSNKDSDSLFISKKRTTVSRFQKSGHTHNHYEIMIVTASSGEPWFFQVGTAIYTCGAYSIQFTAPGEKHMSIRNTKNSSRILVNMRDSYANPIVHFLNIDINELFSNHVLNYKKEQFEKIKRVLDEAYSEFRSSISYSKNTRLKLLLSTALCEMSKYENIANFSIIKKDSIDIVDIIKSHIESNYANKITLDEIASLVKENKFYLCRRFKDTTGYTIFDYILNVRLGKSMEYLSNSSMSVIKISEIVGFKSPSYFSNKFKEHYGISPTEYRQSL